MAFFVRIPLYGEHRLTDTNLGRNIRLVKMDADEITVGQRRYAIP